MDIKTLQPGDPPELALAFAQLGLREIPGPEHEKLVLEMFGASGHPEVKDDETSWCAAFQNWIEVQLGRPGTGSLLARDFLDWGELVESPRRGDIAVFERGTEAWQGHVGRYLGEAGGYIWIIGGNQTKLGQVSVARWPKSKLLGYRRHAAATAPAPMPAEARPMPQPSESEIRYVQTVLRALGYAEVGEVDGKMGSMTRGAILAFRADNGLELTPAIDDALLAALPRAKPRPMAAERTEATPREVREQAPEAKSNFFTWVLGLVLGGWGFIQAFGGFVIENVGEVKRLAQPLLEAAGDVPWWGYGVVFAGVGLWLFFNGRKGEAAAVAAFREGARR